MNPGKIANVLHLSVEERYSYFVRKVVGMEELWSIYYNDGWAALSDSASRTIIPFWPEEEFALLCCTEQWQNYQRKHISLNDFMQKWLPGMIADQRLANIFYTPLTTNGSIVSPQVLLEDLNDEMEKYI